jgi:polyferredoxin/Pyruvate/2-oxoacid:ferredoxin oxidoreductase delta subunit
LRKARRATQLAILAFFMFLVFVNAFPYAFSYPVDLFMRLDPYTSFAAAIASRQLIWRLLPSLVVLASAFLVGRAFCGWFCPMGTALDCCSRLFRLKCKPLRYKGLANLKYFILFMTLSAAVFGVTLVHFFDPIMIAERSGIFVVRKAVSGILLGAGNLVPSSSSLGALISSSPVEDRFYSLAVLFALIFGVLLLAEVLNRRFWCRYLCPLGALLSLPARVAPIKRLVSGCESTNICKKACVFGVIGEDPRTTRQGECTLCMRCEPICPHDAISFGFGPRESEGISLDRRAVTASLVAGLVLSMVPGGKNLSRPPRKQPMRPPGAIPEDRFLAACTRCGACVGACVTGGLQPAFLEAGFEGMWTPILVGRLGGCEAECNLCGKVCNTQAIRHLPLEEKKKFKMGKAVINRDLCLAWKEERVCYLCDEVCPYGAIGFVKDQNTAFDKPAILPDKCTGCGLCEWKCPVDPPAIYAVPLSGGTS